MSDIPSAARVLLPGFLGTELPEWLARRLDAGLAGVCLFGNNIVDPQQLRALTDDIVAHNPKAIIALDEEGGDVTRLYYAVGAPSPGNAWLGRFDDETYTFEAAADIARQLRDVGCNLNFAPTVDVNSNPANPVIGVRSFSADPAVASRHTKAWVRGHQSAGVAVSAKHFPGHGDTQTDSHLALPVVDADVETLAARDLPPFRAAIEADAWTIMTSHIVLPALDATHPATFSPAILERLLRHRLGFTGVIVSDALDMAGASAETGIPEAAVRALVGGCDLLCIGTDNSDDQLSEIETAITAAVRAERLPAERLADASGRVAGLGMRLASTRSPHGPTTLTGTSSPGEDEELRRVASVFDVSSRGEQLLQDARVRGSDWAVVQALTTPNLAVGSAPWGPIAASPSNSHEAPQRRVRVVAEDVDAVSLLNQLGESPVALVGRDNHRHEWVRSLVDDLRRIRSDVLVVDMGWPDEGRTYADVATFGSSRLLGAGLLWFLDGAVVRMSEVGT